MDGQYYSPQQHHGLPLSYQYDESEDLSQSSLRLFSFDNLPQPQQLEHRFMTTSPSTSQLLPETYGLPSQMPMSQPPQMWNSPIQCSPGFNSQQENNNREDYGFEPSGYITGNESDSMFSRGGMNYGETPRTTWEQYNPRLLQDNIIPSFEPSDYISEDIKPNMQNHDLNNVEMDYNTMENTHQDYLPPSMSRSPMQEDDYANSPMLPNNFVSADGLPFDKPSPFGVPSSSLSEDGSANHSREMTAMETEDQGADEPYAKLIYRALMSAPNHSMVLQEIYQWFRDHTSKGSSDSKGWMNSIRHNLSMNAAFKKTERKLSTDDTKKSTEWVLEPFAIKDGVQSTTRYRKGTASKKFIRSETPAPSRQISGRKGGMSTKNSLRFRHRAAAIGIDTSFGGNGNSNGGSGSGLILRLPQFMGNHSHGHSLSQSSSSRGGNGGEQRHRSPLTPPLQPMGPYYFGGKVETYHGHEMDGFGSGEMCGLEEVQGVLVDDGPVFATNQEMGYHHGFPGLGGGRHDHHPY